MQVQYGSVIVAAGGLEGPSGIRLNGRAITDEASFFRAVAETMFARGNKSTELTFGVWKAFNTRADAEAFAVSHWSALPTSELLTITCGDGETGEQVYQMAGAVLSPVQISAINGLSLLAQYTFTGGVFSAETVSPSSEDTVIKRGTVALAAGDTSKAVAFASAFGAVPVLQVRAMSPAASADALPDWDADAADITAAGFTARGQPVPDAGYVLSWIAVAP